MHRKKKIIITKLRRKIWSNWFEQITDFGQPSELSRCLCFRDADGAPTLVVKKRFDAKDNIFGFDGYNDLKWRQCPLDILAFDSCHKRSKIIKIKNKKPKK